MGASDIENAVSSLIENAHNLNKKRYIIMYVPVFCKFSLQDSMIDIVTSLGCDERKLILTGTALSNKFDLLDDKKNTPGSASTGSPSVITYQQVCLL